MGAAAAAARIIVVVVVVFAEGQRSGWSSFCIMHTRIGGGGGDDKKRRPKLSFSLISYYTYEKRRSSLAAQVEAERETKEVTQGTQAKTR